MISADVLAADIFLLSVSHPLWVLIYFGHFGNRKIWILLVTRCTIFFLSIFTFSTQFFRSIKTIFSAFQNDMFNIFRETYRAMMLEHSVCSKVNLPINVHKPAQGDIHSNSYEAQAYNIQQHSYLSNAREMSSV